MRCNQPHGLATAIGMHGLSEGSDLALCIWEIA